MPQAEPTLSQQKVRGDSDRRRQMMLEAFEDVDQGRLIDHQDVLDWADGLDDVQPLPLPR